MGTQASVGVRSQFSIRRRDNHALGMTLGRYMLFDTFYYYWDEEYGSLYQGLRYIRVPLYWHCCLIHVSINASTSISKQQPPY